MKLRATLVAATLLAAASAAPAQNAMLDALKNKLGGGENGGTNSSNSSNTGSSMAAGGAAGALAGLGLKMPAMGSSTMGNAAGVLQYCIKNNYLSADAAGGVKDKLMGMVTGQKAQQTGYANGSNGLLQGSDGKSFNLKSIGSKLKTQACDYVLNNAKSFV